MVLFIGLLVFTVSFFVILTAIPGFFAYPHIVFIQIVFNVLLAAAFDRIGVNYYGTVCGDEMSDGAFMSVE